MPTVVDGDFAWEDSRMIVIGASLRERLLFAVHVDRGERDRIISARRATAGEREVYETGDQP
jgi:uncharacterized DUF497 family protein